MHNRVLTFSILACALALGACKRTEPPVSAAVTEPAASPAAKATSPDPGSADDNLNAVLWVQASAEYRALSEQTYRSAADHLDKALKEKHWDALVPGERANAATGLKPAVVMDVDETVLDNSPYQARLVRDGKEYDEVTWAA
ncbi:MAG: acid phosphatase, partial [Pseudomonadota bacterium]|nr:acid phosphatase [Pseudomonadota bacterium]